MARTIHWGKVTCPRCGDRITKNALGRAAHMKWCTGTPRPEPTQAECEAYIARLKARDIAEGIE